MSQQQGPLIHLNGTDFNTLFHEYGEVRRLLGAAVESAGKATFHKRDYYPLGEEERERARAEHVKHLKAIQDAHDYFQNILIRLKEQQ